MDEEKQDSCKLCGRLKSEVPLLVEGINGNVCNDCISQAFKVIQKELKSNFENTPSKPCCAMCGRFQKEVPLLMEGVTGHICSFCTSSLHQIIQLKM